MTLDVSLLCRLDCLMVSYIDLEALNVPAACKQIAAEYYFNITFVGAKYEFSCNEEHRELNRDKARGVAQFSKRVHLLC